MATWLEIVDTAVKIGLGAIIAGGFAFIKDKTQEKKEKRKFYLEQNHKIILSVTEKISAFHEEFRHCATNQVQDPQAKFATMWNHIKLATEASTYLLFLGLETSQKKFISYINKCEDYIGKSQEKIINDSDDYQNRVEPQYREIINSYEELIKSLKADFISTH